MCQQHAICISSLTGDSFRQAPLWKSHAKKHIVLERDFVEMANGCATVGAAMMVVPLVDNGRLEDMADKMRVSTHCLQLEI